MTDATTQGRENFRRAAGEVFTRAIIALNRSEAFYAYVAKAQLEAIEDPTCPTGWTDGKHLAYNPEWLATLSVDEARSFVAHEVEHVIKGDPWRLLRISEELRKFYNQGSDESINNRLKRNGFLIPSDWLCDPRFDGMSTEEIIAILKDEQPPQNDAQSEPEAGEGEGAGDSSDAGSDDPDANDGQSEGSEMSSGECRPYPVESVDADEVKHEIEKGIGELRQVMASAKKWAETRGGFGSEGLQREVEEAVAPSVPYEEILREFMTNAVREDASWNRPQRDYFEQDIYMPTLNSPGEPEVIFAVDTSLSMNAPAFGVASRDVHKIAQDMNAKLTVIYCDSMVRKVDEFEAGEPVKFNPVGGGGTDFRPVFDWVERNMEEPQVVVYFTDICGPWPAGDPGVPTIIVQWGNSDRELPGWAEHVSIEGEY